VPGSTLDGRTLANIRFRERYQLMVLALFRSNKWASSQGTEHTEETRLHSGDVLLVQGSIKNIDRLKSSRNLLVLDAKSALPISSRAPLAVLIMAGIILSAAFGLLPISISALCGVVLLLMTGCLKWYDTTRALSAPVILIIATSLAMGTAMVETGGALMIAKAYVDLTSGLSPTMILSGLLAMMALLTNVVSNNAAAVIGTPIAIGIAQQLGHPQQTVENVSQLMPQFCRMKIPRTGWIKKVELVPLHDSPCTPHEILPAGRPGGARCPLPTNVHRRANTDNSCLTRPDSIFSRTCPYACLSPSPS